jgi:hypothetical protein
MRRAFAGVWIAVVLSAAFLACPSSGYATTANPTEPPPPTLAGGRSLSECISSAPRPGCVTRTDSDSHQVITFAILMLGMAFIGWRIARSVRRRDAGN